MNVLEHGTEVNISTQEGGSNRTLKNSALRAAKQFVFFKIQAYNSGDPMADDEIDTNITEMDTTYTSSIGKPEGRRSHVRLSCRQSG